MILAGDIGGTSTRLALCEKDGEKFCVVREGKFSSAEFSGLEAIVNEFLGGIGMKMLVQRRKKSTNGWLKIAPMRRKKFKMFSAEAGQVRMISSVSRMFDGRVKAMPAQCSKNPDRHD